MLKKTTSQTKLQSSNSKNLSGSNSIAYSAEISFKNKFRSLMKELLKRIEEYKIGKNKNTLDLNQLTQFLDSKIASKKGEYYDFLHEEDPILLKILIQFLYEELENILHTSKHKQYANLNNIKGLKKVINDYEKLKLSPEPLTLTRKLEKYDEKPKSLLSCLEKLNQFNDLLRNLKSYFWQILNDDIEYEKITFKTEQHKRNYVQTLEQIYDKTNKTLDNNILFLQSFSIYDDIDDEKFFDEGRLNDKLINSIEIKNGNSLINENSSPFKNISNEIGEHMKDKIIDKLEKENGILQKQLEYIRSPQKNSSPMKKSNYNEEFRNLQDENFSLKMKVEELRKEFSKISSNVIKSMSERDIQSKQILNENERLLRIKNLNNIDFQSLEQKYQQKIVDLRKEVSLGQEKILKLIEEKQELIKENKNLKINDKQNIFTTKANNLQIDQLNSILNETQKELSKCKIQYSLLLEKLEMIQKIQNKPGSNLNFENELKNSEKKNSELFKEKKELLLLLEKLHQDNNELQKELNLKNNMSNRHVSNPLSNNNVDFNDLSEIQLLSNMILLFSKYKNNQLEEKTRLIIEKYLKETQKNYFQSLEISIKELNGKYYSILEKFKNRLTGTLLLYQDLKWILGILDEKKSMISGLNSKNYETIAKAILEEEFIRSVSLKNKTSEWSKDHNALKEELDEIIKDLTKNTAKEEKIEKKSLNNEMDDLRIIIDSLTSDNQDLRNSVVKMNKEVHNINQINNQELKSNKYSPKAEEKENIFVYSNESFGQSPKEKKDDTNNLFNSEKTNTEILMIHLQAIVIENLLQNLSQT